MRHNTAFVVMLGCLATGALAVAPGYAGPVALPFSENFNSPAPSADATVDYPAFTATLGDPPPEGGSTTVDSGGVLHLSPGADGGELRFTVTPSPSPTGEIVIKAKFGTIADIPQLDENGGTIGNFDSGLVIGGCSIIIVPGYTPSNGYFRIDTPAGVGAVTSMGFTPADGVLHNLEVHSFSDGMFTIKVTDGQDPLKVFETTFTNASSYGGEIGLRRGGRGAGASGHGIFDDFSVAVAGAMLPGDVNFDGFVDIFDVNLVSANWGTTGPTGDANGDMIVDIFDVNLISANWSPPPAPGGPAAVPEPSSMILLGLGTLAALVYVRVRPKDPV